MDFNKKEQDIIFDYLIKGIRYLNIQVAPLLSTDGFVTKFSGVFVHSKPLVHPKPAADTFNNSCEIGDLLVLYVLLNKQKRLVHQRAFISQAKKINRMDNKCQHYLYEIAKEFQYARGACTYNRERRTLPRIHYRHNAFNYLLLEPEFPYIKLILLMLTLVFLGGLL